jgi:transposase
MDKQGKVIDKARIESRPQELRDYFKDTAEPVSVVLEACYNWGYFADILDGIAAKVTLAHPLKTKAIADARIKTDTIDSKTLADLLRADLIPEAYIPDKETRLMKNYLRYRAGLVALSTAIKCKIHALVDQHDYAERETLAQLSDTFGKKGLGLLAQVKLPGYDTQILRSWLELLEHIKSEITQANRWVREHVREDESASLLKTIPGIGDQFVLAVGQNRPARVESK